MKKGINKRKKWLYFGIVIGLFVMTLHPIVTAIASQEEDQRNERVGPKIKLSKQIKENKKSDATKQKDKDKKDSSSQTSTTSETDTTTVNSTADSTTTSTTSSDSDTTATNSSNTDSTTTSNSTTHSSLESTISTSSSSQNVESGSVSESSNTPLNWTEEELVVVRRDEHTMKDNYEISIQKNTTTEEFIKEIGEQAQKLAWDNDLYGSIMIAQAILESASGNSELSRKPNYNLFGVKGTFGGQSIKMETSEDGGDGELKIIQDDFRKYPNYSESLNDYVKLLKAGIYGNTDFYHGVWKKNTENYQQATLFLTGKYATDTKYNIKLNKLIEVYHLTRFDKDPTIKAEQKKLETTHKNPKKLEKQIKNEKKEQQAEKQLKRKKIMNKKNKNKKIKEQQKWQVRPVLEIELNENLKRGW